MKSDKIKSAIIIIIFTLIIFGAGRLVRNALQDFGYKHTAYTVIYTSGPDAVNTIDVQYMDEEA